MAVTKVQDTLFNSTGTTLSLAVTVTSTGTNNALILVVDHSTTAAPSTSVSGVTDNQGSTWVNAGAVNPSGTKVAAEIWYVKNAPSGVTTVTIAMTAAANIVGRMYEFSGLLTSGTLVDVTHSGSNTGSTAPSSGTTSTSAHDNELAIGTLCIGASAPTISGLPGAFSNETQHSHAVTNANVTEQTGYDLATSAQTFTYNATLATQSSWAAVVVSFVDAQQPITRTATDTVGAPSDAVTLGLASTRTPSDAVPAISDSPDLNLVPDAIAALTESLTSTIGKSVSDNIGGGATRQLLDGAMPIMSPRAWFANAAPTGQGVFEGGLVISYDGGPPPSGPPWDGLDADRANHTSFNGNGYGYGEMTPTAGPTLTGNSSAPCTTTTNVTNGQVFNGSTAINLSAAVTIAKGQLVELNDGSGHTWRFASKNSVTAGTSVVPVSGSTATSAFPTGSTLKMVWDVAVLETFRGNQDSPDPASGPGSTPFTQVADTFGTLNIGVSYVPSCPHGLGDFTPSNPTYRLLIRAAKAAPTLFNPNSFQLIANTQSTSNPVTWTITTSVGTQYSSSVSSYNNPPHDQLVDLRWLRLWQTMRYTFGETTYAAYYDQAKQAVIEEFDGLGGGLRPWQTKILLELAAFDPAYVGPTFTNSKGQTGGGKTWEQLALQFLRDMKTKNFDNPNVGMYVDPTASGNPTPSTYATGTTLGTALVSGTAYTTLTLAAPIGTALSAGQTVRLDEAGHTQVFFLSAPALSSATSLSIHDVVNSSFSYKATANFSYTTAATVKPCNTPLGQARFEYACSAAMAFYLGSIRAWVDPSVTSTEKASWAAAGASCISELSAGNLQNPTTHLPFQQTYIDADRSGVAAFAEYTGDVTNIKPADSGDAVYHLLLASIYGSDASALTLAKQVIAAIFNPAYGIYDTTNGGLWFQIHSDGTNLQTTYKEVGRLGYWLGVFRLLNTILEPGLWDAQYADWFNFVTVSSYRPWAGGWVYRTNGDYSTYHATIVNSGTGTSFGVDENWVTLEATGLALTQVADNVSGAVSETLTVQQAPGRDPTDTLGAPSDAPTTAATGARQPADTVASPTDTATQTGVGRTRTPADTVGTPADAVTEGAARTRAPSDTVAGLSEATTQAQTEGRSAADTVAGPSDAATRGGSAEARSPSDAVGGVTETLHATSTGSSGLTDTFGAPSDALTRGAQTEARSAAESVASPTDSASRGGSAEPRTAADTVATPSDAVTTTGRGGTRTATDTVAAPSDAVTSRQAEPRSILDLIAGTSDAISIGGSPARTAADTEAAPTEGITPLSARSRTPTDTVAAPTDALTDTAGQIRTPSDALAAPTEAAAPTTGRQRSPSDTEPAPTDVAALGQTRKPADTVGAPTDTPTEIAARARTAGDTARAPVESVSATVQLTTANTVEPTDVVIPQPSDTVAEGTTHPRAPHDIQSAPSETLADQPGRTAADALPVMPETIVVVNVEHPRITYGTLVAAGASAKVTKDA